MGGGPVAPRYPRIGFINGQAGSRKMDGGGNRPAMNSVKNQRCYAYGSSNKAAPGGVSNTQYNSSNCMSHPSTSNKSFHAFALSMGHGGTGGGPAEAGGGHYVGGSPTTTTGNPNSMPAHNSYNVSTYKMHYYTATNFNAQGQFVQQYGCGGGGWGAAGGMRSTIDYLSSGNPRRTGYGGAGGAAIKTNGYSCTISSGSNRIYGSIVS